MNEPNKTFFKAFASLVWYDKCIEFLFSFVAKTSEPLLAAGIVYSAADVLSHGSLGGADKNPLFIGAFGIAQSLAIESSGGVVLVYGLQSVKEKDFVKAWLYLTLATLLAVVGGVMLFMQLAGWTEQGNSPFMLTMFAFRSLVSVGYIYLCRTKSIQFNAIQAVSVQQQSPTPPVPAQPSLTLDDVRLLMAEMLAQVKATEVQCLENEQPLQISERTRCTKKKVEVSVTEEETEIAEIPENFQRVQAFLADRPTAKVRDVAGALEISPTTANKWMHRVRETP